MTDLDFGNTQPRAELGKTIGFWSNKNGRALITEQDIAVLNALNLKDASGADVEFTGGDLSDQTKQLRTFLLGASAENMANMLSAQLAGAVLNIRHGFFGGSTSVYVDGLLTSWSGNSQSGNLATNLDNDGDADNADSDGNIDATGLALIGDDLATFGLIKAANDELALHGTAYSGDVWRDYQEALKIAFDGMNNNLAIFAP